MDVDLTLVPYSKGRTKALASLREWLNHFYPQKPLEERPIAFLPFREREKALQAKQDLLAKKIKKELGWRAQLSDELGLTEEEILKATNTVLELIEKALSNGERVRLANFGSFKSITRREERTILFRPTEDWQREINSPLYQNEIGLMKKFKKGKLERRT